MTQQAVGYEDSDIPLESGRLRARRWGAADAPAVVCVPGLSANLSGFDRLAERLAGDTLQLVAIALRGRGRSEVTGAGTYGWRHHARDVLGAKSEIGKVYQEMAGEVTHCPVRAGGAEAGLRRRDRIHHCLGPAEGCREEIDGVGRHCVTLLIRRASSVLPNCTPAPLASYSAGA